MYLFAFMEHPSLTQSSSTFSINCSWQNVYMLSIFSEVVVVDPCNAMLLFLPCLASMPCLLAGCMLSLSCHALWWVHRARKHAYLISVLPCSSFLLGLNLLTIIAMFTWLPLYFLIPFGLWRKGLLLYALISFMPCLDLPWYDPISCCHLALNIAFWC